MSLREILKQRGVSIVSLPLSPALYTGSHSWRNGFGLILPRAQGVVLTLWKGASDCREVP